MRPLIHTCPVHPRRNLKTHLPGCPASPGWCRCFAPAAGSGGGSPASGGRAHQRKGCYDRYQSTPVALNHIRLASWPTHLRIQVSACCLHAGLVCKAPVPRAACVVGTGSQLAAGSEECAIACIGGGDQPTRTAIIMHEMSSSIPQLTSC